MAFISHHIYQLFDLLPQILGPFGFLGDGRGNLKILKVLKNDNTSWKRVAISSISALKSLGWVVVVGVSMIITSAYKSKSLIYDFLFRLALRLRLDNDWCLYLYF